MSEQKMKIENKFNLEALKISQNFHEQVGVEQKLTSVKPRKPKKQEFVRAHDEPEYSIDVGLIDFEEDNETYLVAPNLIASLSDYAYPARVCLSVNRQGTAFLWKLKLPKPDGRILEWHTSALSALEEAKKDWVRVSANMNAGSYDLFKPTSKLPDPVWPEENLQELIEIAFRDRFIDSLDHLVVRKLMGAE